ncbi:MAG: glycerol-3-phosphate dehydrogenase/oxidase [Candidatus Omnitrophica bacterium]|nr:glycerol-3-phosphate dehydrogenase/oxidase [Candidatus Omnitrophota bacterium]
MTRDVSALSARTFDLLVVGGGIMGAGVAWDAAQRGLSCALVEQGDFAGGTSSKTTKLIHGGIRYLENMEFKLVRQAIQERGTLLASAPTLIKPLQFLIPIIGNSPRPWPLVRLGVALYDLLAGKARLGRHRFVNQLQMREEEPLLSQTAAHRGAIYFDAQMDDARLVFEVVRAAAEAGAIAVNHCRVVEWRLEGGRVVGAELEDRLKGGRYPVRCRLAVNAAGPWVDQLRRLADSSAKPIVRPSKGIHLVYPDLGLKEALLLSSPKDGRIFFLIPWKGLTLIGTTDTDFSGDPGDAATDTNDVDYLIGETNRLLPQLHLEKSKIISTFAGVRPLVAQEKKDPWAVSRAHLLHEDPNGLVSLVGGKFTTFRSVAEEVIDWAGRRFPEKRLAACRTAESPLGLAPDRLQTIRNWIQADPKMAQPLCPHHPFTQADVRYAVEEEMAMTLSDLLWRRFGVGWSACQGLDMCEPAARIMGDLLAWSESDRGSQIELYHSEVASAHRY